MPADGRDLEDRLSRCTGADTVRGVFFRGALVVVESLCGPSEARRLTGDRTFNLLGAYPVADFLQLLWTAADAIEPRVGDNSEAFRRLGRRAVDDFFGSAVGKAILAFTRRDPRKMVNSAAIAYRSAVSYGERRVTWRGERVAVLRYERDFLVGPYHEGVITAALQATGAATVKASCRLIAPLTAEYDVSWT